MFSKAWSRQHWKCMETKEVQPGASSAVTVIVPSGLFSWPAPSDQLGVKTKYISRIKLITLMKYLFIFLGWERNSREKSLYAIIPKIGGIEQPCCFHQMMTCCRLSRWSTGSPFWGSGAPGHADTTGPRLLQGRGITAYTPQLQLGHGARSQAALGAAFSYSPVPP